MRGLWFFKLTPSGSGWTESVIYSFTGGADGKWPFAGLVADTQGNLFGTTYAGGSGSGVVFELAPSGSAWMETVIHTFTGSPDGAGPEAKLLRDSQGNLYGTTTSGGLNITCPGIGGTACGTVFKLTPNGSQWTESVLWPFTGGTDGSSPYGPVVMDGQRNLYGVAAWGGDFNNPNCLLNGPPAGCGVVFKLSMNNEGQ